jgi:trigger factor
MNIKHESTGELSATIKIEVGQADYLDKVNNSLKEIQKKSSLKGFRPGKVPPGLVKKMYEKSVVAEEVNKLLSESLNQYITENKLDILGYPLANEEKNKNIDFENSTDFEFYFDIAFTPSIVLDISQNRSMDYYDISVEETVVDNYLDDTRRRFGKFIESESVAEGDFLQVEISEVDENRMIKEDGIKNNTSISLLHIKDEDIKQEILGKKIGDKIIFNPLKATGNIIETTTMLGIDKDESEKAEADFEFMILKISRIEQAEINEELFKNVFPDSEISDEKQFRERLAEEAKGYYQIESDNFFVHTTMESLINDTKFDLPDEFIKRWLVDSDGKLTAEMVEENYHIYIKSLKHQLIINKMIKEYHINVDDQQMRDHIRDLFIKRYHFDPLDEEKNKQLDSIVESVLKNKDEATKIYDQLFDEKMRELFKTGFKLHNKEVSYTEFVNIVNEHHKIHHHEHAE